MIERKIGYYLLFTCVLFILAINAYSVTDRYFYNKYHGAIFCENGKLEYKNITYQALYVHDGKIEYIPPPYNSVRLFKGKEYFDLTCGVI